MHTIRFDPFPVLSTDRLLLRSVSPGDVPEIFFLRSDAQVMKYLDRDPLRSPEETAAFIGRILAEEKGGDGITWGIALKGDPRLIGVVCVRNIRKEHHRGELGYMLHPGHQKKGIMQEALSPVLGYSFGTLKLHSLEANVNPHNAASIKLLERNGFVREAYFREDYYFNGKFLDSAIYSLLTPVKAAE